MAVNDPSFPIGDFVKDDIPDTSKRFERIAVIRELPSSLRNAVAGLTDAQLETPYREGGWTLRQTVHHLADSHQNSLIRFKLALTEDVAPTIKPYFQERWAELADYRLPVEVSLYLIDSLHTRWVALLGSMTDSDYARTFIHPDTGEWTLEDALALYAWHSKHHTAHITTLRTSMGW